MKVNFTKILALGGLCALFASAGSNVFAQGSMRSDRYNHHYIGRSQRISTLELRQRIQEQQRIYARNMRLGNHEAARRAHLRAEELRSRLRERRDF